MTTFNNHFYFKSNIAGGAHCAPFFAAFYKSMNISQQKMIWLRVENKDVFWYTRCLKSITVKNPKCVISNDSAKVIDRSSVFVYAPDPSYAKDYAEQNGYKFSPLNVTTTQKVTTTTAKPTTTAPVSTIIEGDANGDKTIDGRDASMILTYYSKVSVGYKKSITEFAEEMKNDKSKTQPLPFGIETEFFRNLW